MMQQDSVKESGDGNMAQIAGEIIKIAGPMVYDAWKHSQEQRKAAYEEREAAKERNKGTNIHLISKDGHRGPDCYSFDNETGKADIKVLDFSHVHHSRPWKLPMNSNNNIIQSH
jgi:hypothetical protein